MPKYGANSVYHYAESEAEWGGVLHVHRIGDASDSTEQAGDAQQKQDRRSARHRPQNLRARSPVEHRAKLLSRQHLSVLFGVSATGFNSRSRKFDL